MRKSPNCADVMKTPLVSVIINNYNYARFLPDAIDSALRQTYGNKEIIVVDDGSTDNSAEIIAGYEDLVVPVLKKNGGQASAFNAGFAVSSGALICFLDSDDVWMPTKVEDVVDVALAYPNSILIYHQIRKVDEQRVPYGKVLPKKVFHGDIAKVVSRTGGWWDCPPTSALTFRRGFLETALNIPENEYRLWADEYLAQLSPFLGHVYGLRKLLAFYRMHGSNMGWEQNRALLSGLPEAVLARVRKYEHGVKSLNRSFERLNLASQVALEDHFPYLHYKWKLGDGVNVLVLSLLALRFRGFQGIMSKIRAIIKLWLELLGLRRGARLAGKEQ